MKWRDVIGDAGGIATDAGHEIVVDGPGLVALDPDLQVLLGLNTQVLFALLVLKADLVGGVRVAIQAAAGFDPALV